MVKGGAGGRVTSPTAAKATQEILRPGRVHGKREPGLLAICRPEKHALGVGPT